MKPESARRIADAYFEVFEELSIKAFNQGMEMVMKSLEDRIRFLRPVRTRDDFCARLLKEPEPEPFALDAQIEWIYMLPYTLRKVLPEAMRGAVDMFPRDPGGRPYALTDEQSRTVCEEIGKLFAKGVRLVDAQRRLSTRMGVSPRTIQRAWQGRAKWFAREHEISDIEDRKKD